MNGKCRVSVVFLSSCCFPCQNLLTLLVLSSHCPHFQTYINMMNDRIRRQYAYENPFHFKWIRSLGQAGGPFCIGLLVGVPSSSSPLSPSDAVWSTLPFRPIPGQTGSVCPVMAVHCACTAKRSPCLCHLLTLQSRTHRCPPSGRGGGQFPRVGPRSVGDSLDHFEDAGPSVVLASPGMLQPGTSRDLFERWCTDQKSGCIFAGYSVEGTLAKQVSPLPLIRQCPVVGGGLHFRVPPGKLTDFKEGGDPPFSAVIALREIHGEGSTTPFFRSAAFPPEPGSSGGR